MKNQFPLRAKYRNSDLVIEFVSEDAGTVVIGDSVYKIGHYSNSWLYGCFNQGYWTILDPENQSMNTTESTNPQKVLKSLPEKWYIKTINPVFCTEIQKRLFKLGWEWPARNKEVQYTYHSAILHSYSDNMFVRNSDEEDFRTTEYASHTEITIEQLFSLSPLPVEIPLNVAGYKGTATKETIKIGCQEMSMENYKKLRAEIEEYRKPKPFKYLHEKFKDFKTQVCLSEQGINITSSSLGNVPMQYKEFDELDKALEPLF